MAYIDGMRLRLDANEMHEFHELVTHPDPEALRRRDELFAELDQNPGVFNDDGSFEFEFTLEPETTTVSHTEPIKCSCAEFRVSVEIRYTREVVQKNAAVTMQAERTDTLLAA